MYSDYSYYQFDLLSDAKIIEPDIFNDERGSLYTTFLKKEYESFLPKNIEFVHDKFAYSKKCFERNSWRFFFLEINNMC